VSEDEKTRDVRRSFYLAQSLFLAVSDVRSSLRVELRRETEDALLGVLHRHLELAWNDGARREADLRAAVAVEQDRRARAERQVEELKRALQEALKRVSDGR
jgi:hypothetical protein